MNPEPGATLGEGGRFLIRRRLGAGGMGVVYQALDRVRNVEVALKTLPKIEPRALYRFKREFRLLADLADPNLASLHELFASGDQWFFTMELVDGVDFLTFVRADEAARRVAAGYQQRNRQRRDAIDPRVAPSPLARAERNPLAPIGEFTRITSATRQLASALRTLHRAGRLHCDLKPSNVMVTAEGRVVVLDFGLALEFDVGQASADTGGEWFGTVEYMAPEQAVGRVAHAGLGLVRRGDDAVRGDHRPAAVPRLDVRRAVGQAARRSPSRRAGSIRPCPPTSSSSACSCWRHSRPTGPDAADVLRMLGGGTAAPVIVHRASGCGACRPRASSRNAAACVSRVGGRAGRSGCSRTGRPAWARAPWSITSPTRCSRARRRWCWRDAVTSRSRCATRRSTAWSTRSAATWPSCRPTRCARCCRRTSRCWRRCSRCSSGWTRSRRAPPGARRLSARRNSATARRSRLPSCWGRWPHDSPWCWPSTTCSGATRTARGCCWTCSAGRTPRPCCWSDRIARSTPPTARACRRCCGRTRRLLCERRELAIDALEPADAERLALGLLGRDFPMAGVMATRIAEEAGGSPFFIRALVDHVQAESQLAGPGLLAEGTTLDEVLRRRFSRLRSGSRRLLDVIAVAGRPIAEAEAYAAAGIDERDPALVSALRAANMIRSTSGDVRELETYHDRVRQAVVASLAGPALTDTHRRLAETLDAKGTVDPEWLAAHYQGAGDQTRAADTLRARGGDRRATAGLRSGGRPVSARARVERRHRRRAVSPARRPGRRAGQRRPRPAGRRDLPAGRRAGAGRRGPGARAKGGLSVPASAGTSTRAARCWPTA